VNAPSSAPVAWQLRTRRRTSQIGTNAYSDQVSTTTPLPNKVKWTTDEAGGVVVHTRQAFFYGAMYVLILGAVVLLCGLALGFAPDDGFWKAGFLGFAVAFGVLFLVEANFLFTHHTLLIDGDTVQHRWRRLIGATREAPVSSFMILHVPGDGDSGPWWELGVEHADVTPERGLWVGELPELVRLGTELQERTGLPFDRDPRPPGPGRRPG
jgi:hypothetical protein